MSAETGEDDPNKFLLLLDGLEDSDDNENFGRRVGELLYGSHMHYYIPVFQRQNIGLDLFLSLNEDDLAAVGVSNKDVPKLASLIKSIQPRTASAVNGYITNRGPEPEPKISMKNLLLMQCHTAKQLKHINKMVEIIEHKLKMNKFENTLLDTDYCAARALKILCAELVRQADILCEESKNLNETLLNMTRQISPSIKKKQSLRNLYVWIGIFMSVTPMAVVLWRSLRK